MAHAVACSGQPSDSAGREVDIEVADSTAVYIKSHATIDPLLITHGSWTNIFWHESKHSAG